MCLPALSAPLVARAAKSPDCSVYLAQEVGYFSDTSGTRELWYRGKEGAHDELSHGVVSGVGDTVAFAASVPPAAGVPVFFVGIWCRF
ncbi:MAG: hypothetical protein BJ554DRAFT_8181 [Olpidium bornovanus]|uniref:Uncharacterized protein n=1 Tax=Olpidium bornovanus TaxID=278681 RepID=A0A8H8DIP2_9FUNG|nr:MAG: hypothetical protein BJ554DRAFT_8181 [Olpidium bornovanus]